MEEKLEWRDIGIPVVLVYMAVLISVPQENLGTELQPRWIL